MKLMFIIGQLSYGGAERQLYELAFRLRNTKEYDIIVISLSSNNHPYKKRLESLGIQVIEVERKKGFDLSRIIRLRRIIREYKPDLIHSYLENATNYTFLATLFSSHKYMAAVRNASRNRGLIRVFFDRISHRFARHITVNSHALKKYCMKNLAIPKDKMTTIYNFIDFKRLEKVYYNETAIIRSDLGIAPDDIVIGTIGRLAPQKNPFLFLEIAQDLAEKLPNAKFLVIGDGALRNDLIKAGHDLINQKRLFYPGQTDHPEYYLKIMNVFLLTSLYEGFPNVVLEAMAAKVPVIATPVEGIEEFIIPGKTGFIVEPDKLSFTRQILAIYNKNIQIEPITKEAHLSLHQTFDDKNLLRQFTDLYQRFTR